MPLLFPRRRYRPLIGVILGLAAAFPHLSEKGAFSSVFFLPFSPGSRALRQFLPPVHQLFERKNANRPSN